MQSLFDLHRRGEPMGGLLGGYTPSNEIVDRATMLPIGQYEDGSLTFAWPGFLKDAYEGAVRSYEQGRQLPRADDSGHYAGTPRAEPLDAFNAASIAPMAGVGMRAAGMADDVVRASPQRQQSFQIPPEADIAAQSSAWPPGWGRIADDLEQPDRFADFRDKIGSLTPDLEPYWANSINPEQYAVDTPFLFVERPRVVQQRAPYEADIDLRNLKTQQPGVWGHKVKSMVETGVQPRTPTGTRFDGGPLPLVRMTENGDYVLVDGNHRMSAEVVKGNDIARALVYANPSESFLPSLMTNGMEEYQVANADPAYDANALVAERWRDKPRIQGEPSSYGFGYIEPPSVFQQERIDPPSMWFNPQPLPPPPLFR